MQVPSSGCCFTRGNLLVREDFPNDDDPTLNLPDPGNLGVSLDFYFRVPILTDDV